MWDVHFCKAQICSEMFKENCGIGLDKNLFARDIKRSDFGFLHHKHDWKMSSNTRLRGCGSPYVNHS